MALHCYWAGGCADPRWVASFTKVSFVNQSATGDPQGRKKGFQTVPVSLESLFTPETRDLTCTDSHHSEKTTPEGLNYF